MGNMTILQLYIWSVILLSIGQLYLITRYLLWPRIQRIMHCPWCWQQAGIANEFPPPWSSTICPYHDRMMREQLKAHRLARHLPAVPATKPTVVVQQAEEVQI